MGLGTDPIKHWWEPYENTRQSREIPWQPCEWELDLQAATNWHCRTEGTSVEICTKHNTS